MSYIVPNSTIHLIHNVNLRKDYKHTWLADNATSQYLGLAGQAKYTLNQYTYQREQRAVRVGICNDNLYDINYMAFQNTNYGTKWFYAFVTKTEYINNEVSLVYFELDVMQTWLFDVALKRCFIERQHVIDDSIGSHLMPEPVGLSDYLDDGEVFYSLSTTNHMVFIVAATFEFDQNSGTMSDTGGAYYGNIFSGLYLNVCNNFTELSNLYSSALSAGKLTDIKFIVQFDSRFIVQPNTGTSPQSRTFNCPKPDSTSDLNGYVPKNNKLHTYPYEYLEITNCEGTTKEYLYEDFEDNTQQGYATFILYGSMETDPSVFCVPYDYKGVTGKNMSEGITISDFPRCNIQTPEYQNYVAQHAESIRITNGNIYLGMILNAMTMNFGGVVNRGLKGSEWQADLHDMDRRQNASVSYIAPSNALYNQGDKGLYFHHKTIRYEFAKAIDDYFTMYGYAINKVDMPDRHARQHWTYVKTRGFLASANIPQDDYEKIRSIYDNGITFWVTLAEIGDYSISNPPISI